MGQYNRFATVSIEEVIPLIHSAWKEKSSSRISLATHSVGVSSLRLKTFCQAAMGGKGLKCKHCALAAEYFAIENFTGNKDDKPHLNLYGIKDGKEILFTHDHKLARALGGADSLNNTQVMCAPCNSAKSIKEGHLAREMKKIAKATCTKQ